LVNVVQELLARKRIAPAPTGVWDVCGGSDDIAADIPESLRQLIERQLDALAPEDQQLLEAASIAGGEFDALLLSSLLDASADDIEGRCETLARQGCFLRASGTVVLPGGSHSRRFELFHALYQHILYDRLTDARRRQLHCRIAAAIETRYGRHDLKAAGQLALHLERGGDAERALRYLLVVADRALQRCATAEALASLEHGFELLQRSPPGALRARHELALQSRLAVTLASTRGYAAPEVELAYARARHVCAEDPNPQRLFPILRGQHGLHLVRADFHIAHDLAEQCDRLAEATGDATLVAEAHLAMGESFYYLGQLETARERLAAASSLYEQDVPVPEFRSGSHPRVACLAHSSWTLWLLGCIDASLDAARKLKALADTRTNPFSSTFALVAIAILHQFRREPGAAGDCAGAALLLAREHGFAFFEAQALMVSGWSYAVTGAPAAGQQLLEQGTAVYEATGSAMARPYHLTLLAEARAAAGDSRGALALLDEGRAICEQTGEGWWLPELHRMYAELWPRSADGRRAAERSLEEALRIARGQNSRSLELRAATSLFRRTRWRKKSRNVLEQTLRRFAPQLETPEIASARALLSPSS
jgi:predicted ATPase